MRRADRLFEILQFLRGDRLRTARDIAEKLEVSTRTIWRDIADLQAQGVPIDGERGIGYVLRNTHFLPPLALTREEMEALLWGTRLVETFGDAGLAKAARELQVKIADVSPDDRRNVPASLAAFASHFAQTAQIFLGVIRKAIGERHKLSIAYCDLKGEDSTRIIRPLGLEFWGHVWTLSAWCEAREDFRAFRCDRLLQCERLDEKFRDEPGKRYADMIARIMEGKPEPKAIESLPNLGPYTARRLGEIGIKSEHDLRAIGAAEAYGRLKFQFGREITLNALWAMDAALSGIDWRLLPADRKQELKDKLERRNVSFRKGIDTNYYEPHEQELDNTGPKRDHFTSK